MQAHALTPILNVSSLEASLTRFGAPGHVLRFSHGLVHGRHQSHGDPQHHDHPYDHDHPNHHHHPNRHDHNGQ